MENGSDSMNIGKSSLTNSVLLVGHGAIAALTQDGWRCELRQIKLLRALLCGNYLEETTLRIDALSRCENVNHPSKGNASYKVEKGSGVLTPDRLTDISSN